MRQTTKRILSTFGIDIVRTTSVSQLKQVMKFLLPKNFGHELIRIGGEGDGGYVIPNCLQGISGCFSPGSAGTWKFERELLENFQIPIFLLDRAESKPLDLDDSVIFTNAWLGPSESEGFQTLDNWVSKNIVSNGTNLILQIDIEGAEYLTLLTSSDEILNKFRIIVIEFHFTENWKNLHAFNQYYLPIFEKLQNKFISVHAHPNNCCGYWYFGKLKFPRVIEITFLHKDFVKTEESNKYNKSSTNLDSKNSESNSELFIDWRWIN